MIPSYVWFILGVMFCVAVQFITMAAMTWAPACGY
ncbi:hypothetical protein P6F34_gp35 [Pseudomonas phage MiCath]|uniref:Uncharacterized protein n=1 Tax=Pseudomonas phage MiCath TaxID=3003729 RepID=A0AAE9VEA1_9CAUD|nr:hypothetical protein P6F34_gp35 [Pseudomonas phage MiCath]WAX22387.1 hypothetical protein [Pseudomonas phage MiCath]